MLPGRGRQSRANDIYHSVCGTVCVQRAALWSRRCHHTRRALSHDWYTPLYVCATIEHVTHGPFRCDVTCMSCTVPQCVATAHYVCYVHACTGSPPLVCRYCAALQPKSIADGRIHTARVVYYKYINYEYLQYFTASSALQQFLKDNGEVGAVHGNCSRRMFMTGRADVCLCTSRTKCCICRSLPLSLAMYHVRCMRCVYVPIRMYSRVWMRDMFCPGQAYWNTGSVCGQHAHSIDCVSDQPFPWFATATRRSLCGTNPCVFHDVDGFICLYYTAQLCQWVCSLFRASLRPQVGRGRSMTSSAGYGVTW
jgi:hypothetical protein